MLNASAAKFTFHVTHTLQKSFSTVYALFCIGSYITKSYFYSLLAWNFNCFYIYVAWVILQNLSAAFLHFYGVPCIIFLFLVLNCRHVKTGMVCLLQYTFLTSKPISGIKMGYRLLCDSSAAVLTSLLPVQKKVRDVKWLRSTWEEKYGSVSFNFTIWNYQFFLP